MSPDEEEQTPEAPQPEEIASPEQKPAEGAAPEPPVVPEVPAAEAEQPVAVAAPAQEPAAATVAERPAVERPRTEGRAPEERGRGGPRERGGRRYFGRRKVCSFCVEKAKSIDYKDPAKLRRFVSDRGRIEGRRRTGTCAKHQRWLATALKRARHLALLPYSPEHIRVTGAFASRR